MALLFMDGFGNSDVASKWSISSTGYSVLTSGARTPGGMYGRFSNNGSVLRKQFAAASQLFVGFGLSTNNAVSLTFYGDAGATAHITVMRNSGTGLLEIRRGTSSGTLLATGTTTLLNGQWNYIESSVTVSDTVGEVHVRINGQSIDEVAYVGDTKNAGTNSTIDAINFTNINNATTSFSDFYILDSTGSAPTNTFLGDVTVRTLSPNGNGTYSQLTGSDGNQTDNYQLIDETVFSSTDYVGSATVGNKDTYSVADLPAGVTNIYGVQLNGMMAKSDASAGSARYVLRSGGTDYTGPTRALTTTYTGYYELYSTDPATGAGWTVGAVNSIETGMEVM